MSHRGGCTEEKSQMPTDVVKSENHQA